MKSLKRGHNLSCYFSPLQLCLLTVATLLLLLSIASAASTAEARSWVKTRTYKQSMTEPKESSELLSSTISNGDITISGQDLGYILNLEYPTGSSNTFLMGSTEGGSAYALRFTASGEDILFGYHHEAYDPGKWSIVDSLTMEAVDMYEGMVRIEVSIKLPESGKYFEKRCSIKNIGDTVLANVKFYDYSEPNANGHEEEITEYDSSRNLVYSTNTQGLQRYLGVFSPDLTDAHDLGAFWENGVLERIRLDQLNNASGPFSGDSGFAFRGSLGNLSPGEEKKISVYFVCEDNVDNLKRLVDLIENAPPNTDIKTHEIDSVNGTAKFTWSGSDDSTPPAQLVYMHRLLNPDSPLYGWSDWDSGTTATYPRPPDSRLPDGTYRFQVKAKDADGAIQPDSATYRFTIGAGAPGTIKGRVTDASIPGPSNGIAGAVLLLDPDPFTYCPTTLDNGYFSFSIPAGTYNITASAEGYVSETKTGITVVAGETTELNFALGPASIVWVEVNKDGTYIYDGGAKGNPDLTQRLKRLPAGCVLRKFFENGKPVERSPDGGIRWFHKVEDVTDGTIGWVERGDLDEGGDRSRVKVLLLQNDHPGGFTFERNLYRDISNAEEDIRLLQAVLKEEGSAIYPEGLITGYFGAKTEAAVKRFQEKYSEEILDPIGRTEGTGYVGPRTRTKLNQLLNNIPFREKYELARGRASVVLGEVREHRPADFPIPIQLVLAVIAQEIGADLDNELVSYDCGRGLMQLTSNEAVGGGSEIECYFDNKACLPYLHKAWWENYDRGCCNETNRACLTSECLCYHTMEYQCRHYTNSTQGMAANIEDGLDWLRGRYKETACSQDSLDKVVNGTELSCDEYRIIDAIWRYNGRLISSKECQGHRYLLCVADRLSSLRDYFPYEDNAFAKEWGPKLRFVASRPHTMLALNSPAEVRVYDSEGQVAGVVKGDVKEEIPFSSYDRKLQTVVIAFSYGSYRYQVVGTGAGKYGLETVFVEGGTEIAFNATNIPILEGSVHQYVVDWDALARGEKGVTLQVDNDGDGTFEKTIHAGSTLDGTTTPIANQLPEVSILAPTEGETITSQAYQIGWEATDPDDDASDLSIGIELSSNGKASWTTLTSNEENDGLCEWDLSGTIGGQYFLRITATDPHEASGEAIVGPFTVSRFQWNVIVAPHPVTDAGAVFFYTLPDGTSTAKLMIFSVGGRLLFETPLDVDTTRFPTTSTWNPVDRDGVPLANGPYVYVLVADGKVIGRGKMVIQR